MGKFLEKNHKILAIVGFIVILGVISCGLIFGPFNEILPDSLREKLGYTLNNADNDTDITVRLIVDFNGYHENINETIFFDANQTATAYSILTTANLTVDIRNFINGIFVEGIEGIKKDANHYWWYLYDGENGEIASNRFDLRANNVQEIIWIYKEY
ncbi:MAG: hypothetical protein FK734_17040 [Asgard group archaeon]|nr:hypothetical protein [Asgard group archaeon]